MNLTTLRIVVNLILSFPLPLYLMDQEINPDPESLIKVQTMDIP